MKIKRFNFYLLFFTVYLFSSCSSKPKEEIVDVPGIDSLPQMATCEIVSLVSDSGIIRYRILTDEWLIYDKALQPYWYFPKGAYVEKFDSTLRVDARIKCDTAYFYERRQLWELKGKVHLENLKGEKFDTELLFWDQRTEKVYSDEFIRIEKQDKILTGFGFDSNQELNIYKIRNAKTPQGLFSVDNDQLATPDSVSSVQDTVRLKPKLSRP